ncbi:DNA mismatch repair protein mutS [Pyrenophora tritici-repentis]|uniref:DNA mismatch repair protein MSH3 n=1 Tax=Pyrenophora tritici-repentis (strain Pt-1C-BFP) TaxID=426418 RepID=B2W010_PYRTR|nr:DNA mismatch repair protein mutS [Pyrenophora tritici-repentis Pt-1C-BFP]KAF7451907.1 DNA mismatch repair protein mutS [Pyrenophora tritici-repentis]EDU45523.1 DNA mismatch repair protein mutS [Pyrenophora tritici-repentis Pt-1C-BFP]KAI0589947.1 DNA mismatch repair protein mutS [Pyrenophora tritici-repentis]KAI0592401.1 DNA mismatch repair protein mutS [Pyrenophora tritici-repentis]KAI0615439.1 DNA mismatch repair protein mutS [Pyrenophora tritici-repentis]
MSQRSQPASASYDYYGYSNTQTSRPGTRRNTARPSTARPRTGASTIARVDAQHVVCAIAESRGISPTVGLAFVNLDTAEAVLCQICDSQTFVRTVHKLKVYGPSEILIVSTAASPKSKLFSIIEENIDDIGSKLTLLDRRYWAESTGYDYIHSLAFREDVEAINISVMGNYYAVCCIAAALKYIDLGLGMVFTMHSLRIRYEPSEGSMMIDVSTIYSLELVQNLRDPKSRDCLFGLLNETLTPMGARLLRNNVLQPLTDPEMLNTRYAAVDDMTKKEELFFATRAALKNFLDADRILTALIVTPNKVTLQTTEQAINQVIMLKQFVHSVNPIFEALTGTSATMLNNVRELCAPENVAPVQELIDIVINEDTIYARQPLELRNQRIYAVKSGVNGLLDVARTTYKEATEDAYQHSTELSHEYDIRLDLKFENARQFYIKIATSELEDKVLPPIFTNVIRRKNYIECQTLELMKRNQKACDQAVETLIDGVRSHMSVMFKICEAIAMLDMIGAFAQLVTVNNYTQPQLTDTLAIDAGRHPIKEKIMQTKFVPNDVYATQQTRFQIITGCNMSGKSTYVRSVALMTIMAQIGSYVPANYASFPILHQLFARLGMDDNIETNVSTFSAEMRDIAFILRNVDRHSLVIIDELGRGTSTRDGLAIALAIAEALVSSRALVWFATHFKDLATIMGERAGVQNLHLAVQIDDEHSMTMLYRATQGVVREVHYGLTLARVVPLPPGVIEHATRVAQKVERHMLQREKASETILREKRRKLILNLKEHLVQAHNGVLEGEVLTAWLKELQNEFVNRMTALEAEAANTDYGSEAEDQSQDESESMRDIYESGEEERPSTHASQPSITTAESRIPSSDFESTTRALSEASTIRAVSENERW